MQGSRAIVDRAARLIARDGALDGANASVDRLAARVGVGRAAPGTAVRGHLDASPLQVARTARVHRAKRMLDAADLAMTEVASRAGFRSLRRFNAVFAEIYRASPSEIRRRSRAMRARRT